MSSSQPLHLQVMPTNLILFLCFVIYTSALYTAGGVANPSLIDPVHTRPACSAGPEGIMYGRGATGPYTACSAGAECRCRRGYGSACSARPEIRHTCGATKTTSVYDRYDNSYLIQNDSISYGGSRVSENGTFKLGFFVRGGNTYLGIWYNNSNSEPIVWVANRDRPISAQQQRNCSLVVAQDGIVKLLDSNNHSLWSSNSEKSYGVTVLQLLDTGNLILTDRSSREIRLWESFKNPTDTILEDQSSYFNTSVNLTSWKRPDDPAQGYYTFQRANSTESGLSITKINNPSIPYWESRLSLLPPNLTLFLKGTTQPRYTSLRLVLNPDGIIQLWVMLDTRGQNWSILWTAPKDQCDLHETCGGFGVCDAGNGFMCKCLPGFTPNDPKRWESKDFSADQCTKRTVENCTGDVFWSMPMINLPPNPDSNYRAQSEDKCSGGCRNDCGCKAYSFDPDADPGMFNCQLWTKDLYSIQEEYYHLDNRTLSIRVSPSDIDFGKSACNICGTNVIPYPLSTNSTCGNHNYFNFQCNSSNGQVYFRPTLGGNFYKVSHINEAYMKFVVQLPQQGGTSICETINDTESKLFGHNNSLPFRVTNCSIVHLIGRPVVEEVEISWNPPPPPRCLKSSDCNYWPNTTCYQDTKVCKCAKGFHSDSQFLNCTIVDDHKGISLWVKVGVASTCGLVLLLGTIFVILCLRKRRAKWRPGITEIKTDNDIEDIDIPFVDYESILYATDNFSDANKLGVGGFGPVYKGKLVDGKAVAIKRLSAASAQGVEEFRNEVILIAKLQHRNLVRVLGYCAKENEKILIYEYMPNKSLDAFLFDHTISPILDWTKRFNIIMGIARGLLYLHHDSRLIIIHRDLKPSNILLDEELNPKISDFGLARIVAGNEMAARTARIIGTHGYMSPEYAFDGYFSIKSDVYSFGIVVLEIISGKRCASLLQFENNLMSLLGYAWFLWDKRSPMELVDKSVESYDSSEVKRCINVGLLCVQEDPGDRPTMSTVLLMLSGDNMNLPYPKQPVFVARKPPSETTSSSSKFGKSSSNVELTVTIEGR